MSKILPKEEGLKLNAYRNAIAETTHHGDFRRAWHCAGWAVDLSTKTPDGRDHKVRAELREAHKLWKDSIFGAEFGLKIRDGVGPGQDVEIQWVDDAVAEAKVASCSLGWGAVPWEDLLTTMLGVAIPAS